jgi:hypothetical protein
MSSTALDQKRGKSDPLKRLVMGEGLWVEIRNKLDEQVCSVCSGHVLSSTLHFIRGLGINQCTFSQVVRYLVCESSMFGFNGRIFP